MKTLTPENFDRNFKTLSYKKSLLKSVDVIKETEKAILFRNFGWSPKYMIICAVDGNTTFYLVPTKFNVGENDTSNSNSIWVDIFRKQDQNGLTENGYSL
jgi:hypothetical protein